VRFHVHNLGEVVLVDVADRECTAREARELADALHEAARRAETFARCNTYTGEFGDVRAGPRASFFDLLLSDEGHA